MPRTPREAEHTSTKPLKPAVFYILLALAAGENYGYAIMQAVRDASQGQVAIGAGSFYRHLATLIEEGLVAEATARRAVEDPRRGVYYRITARGQSVLADERRRLAALVAAIDGLRLAPRRGQA